MSQSQKQRVGTKTGWITTVFVFNEDSLLFSCGSLFLILSFLNIMDCLLLSAFAAPAPAKTNKMTIDVCLLLLRPPASGQGCQCPHIVCSPCGHGSCAALSLGWRTSYFSLPSYYTPPPPSPCCCQTGGSCLWCSWSSPCGMPPWCTSPGSLAHNPGLL